MSAFYPPLPESLVRRVHTHAEAVEYGKWLLRCCAQSKAQIEAALNDPHDEVLPHMLVREHNERVSELHRAFTEFERERSASETHVAWLINSRVSSKLAERGSFDRRRRFASQVGTVFSGFASELSYVLHQHAAGWNS